MDNGNKRMLYLSNEERIIMPRQKQAYAAGKADLAVGERRIVEINGRSIGIFNVNGNYHALHNRCPHMAGNLCEGPVTGTTQRTSKTEFIYGQEKELVGSTIKLIKKWPTIMWA